MHLYIQTNSQADKIVKFHSVNINLKNSHKHINTFARRHTNSEMHLYFKLNKKIGKKALAFNSHSFCGSKNYIYEFSVERALEFKSICSYNFLKPIYPRQWELEISFGIGSAYLTGTLARFPNIVTLFIYVITYTDVLGQGI